MRHFRTLADSLKPRASRVILSALMLVALLSGTYLLNGVAVAADRPSQTLFGEGYGRLYQQDQQMMHEMMETLQDMMGTMKEMAKGADKEKITKRMERMDALMKEHAKRASETLFGEGYAQLYQKDRAMVHEMMEMMQEMMGMMKGMAQDAGMKGKVGKRMERMDTLMKEHSEAPLKAIFGTGYPFQPQ